MDIVDEKNNVIGNAPNTLIYEKKLNHRIVHVLIFNDKGEMAIQKRSKTKRFLPGYWCTTVGGHVKANEEYIDAAKRETLEESGVEPEIEFISTYKFPDDRGMTKFLGVFKANHNGPLIPDGKEVEAIEFFSKQQLQEMLNKEKFSPELVFLLDEVLGINQSIPL